MASSDKRNVTPIARRRYVICQNPVRTLHQNMNKTMDIRFWVFESARIVDCCTDESKCQHIGAGWMCATIVQSASEGVTGPAQGSMSIDFAGDSDTGINNIFAKGSVVCNKTVSSVATQGSDGNGGSLVTLVSDASTLQIISVEHTSGHSSGHRMETDTSESSHATSMPVVIGSASSEERRRDRDRTHDDERRKVNGSTHRDRSSASSSGNSSAQSSGAKQKEKRRIEEECSPRGGGDSKRQKISPHDPRTDRDLESSRSGAGVEGNPGDAVAFLNSFASSSLSINDGALPSPAPIETPGFNDLIGFEDDDERSRLSSTEFTETMTDGGIGCMKPLSDSLAMDRTHANHATADPGTEGAGAFHRQERLSNCDLPNPQIEPSNPYFEGVFDSLMKLLSECKDKNANPASTSVSEPSCMGTSQNEPSHRSIFVNRPDNSLKPVCEIRPFIDIQRVVEVAPVPRETTNASNRRRGRGSQSRRSGRTTRGRRNDNTPAANTRGRRRRGRGHVLDLAEDGLEIIESVDSIFASSVTEEETAMAAAMLEDLVEVGDD
nr:protein UL112 [Mastomys natalensis cytomegalovirus 3]